MNRTALLDRTSTGQLEDLGQQLRVDSVRAGDAANSGHPTSSMSAADLMAVLLGRYLRYDFADPHAAGNDHLIFSKGHASPLLYAMFKAAGAITDDELLSSAPGAAAWRGIPPPGCPGWTWPPARSGRGCRSASGWRSPASSSTAAVPRLGAVRRQRAGRGVGLGGVRPGGLQRAGQPDRDRRREPARPARPDPARLGPGRLRPADAAFGWHTIEIDGHDTASTVRTPKPPRDRPATVIMARTRKGRGVASVEDPEGAHGKPLPDAEEAIRELGGLRSTWWGTAARARQGRTRCWPASCTCPATRWGPRSRRVRRSARRWPRSAAPARTWSSSTPRSVTRPRPSTSPRRTPSASSSSTSPSSR